ncbi:MAG: inositol monophosphatase [Dehalococcoidia bacterium]|nr:inositol monophosphatase [Dehalococcoidia bacterium]
MVKFTPAPLAAPLPDDALLAEIEAVALELARLAGVEITATLTREITVQYKREPRGTAAPTDPVSEVDHAIERLLRERLGQRFPAHGIVGEEVPDHPSPDHEFVWAVDPVDGTTNFVNGFPLFACSIGVLHRGRPVVAAVWCSASHELRPGVYHARRGGGLHFEQHPVVPGGRPRTGVTRRLAAAPGGSPRRTARWDHRVTGSAAIESAFVAAGIFSCAIFWSPGLWDVAAGATLLLESGHEVWTRGPGRAGWVPFERFEAPTTVRERRAPSLRDWRRPLIVGERDAVETLRRTARGPSLWRRARFRLRRLLTRR